jgi:holliday junction DNA helicase RuvA
MIRFIEGTLQGQRDLDLIVLVYGIGYLVRSNTNRHNYTIGETIKLHTYLAVRENALDLYGFPEENELTYFELLLTIPKIGPKSALQILCQADPDLLATAIMLQDADHLHKVAGIGKKTAANIVTHLAGKIDPLTTPNITSIATQDNLSNAQVDAIDALITLGYDQKEARVYVTNMDPTMDAKTLIQSVLKQGVKF